VQRSHLRDEGLLERVGDRLMNDEALGRNAGLPDVQVRACTPTRAACSTSALGSTTNGSLPPSSSTTFFTCSPAAAATRAPAARCR
jgi:hypothetical protein